MTEQKDVQQRQTGKMPKISNNNLDNVLVYLRVVHHSPVVTLPLKSLESNLFGIDEYNFN